MEILECHAVSVAYGRHEALKQLSCSLYQGECLGLVGLNGAGKTSLLKALLDFTGLQAGHIKLFGHPHTQPQTRQPLAFLPEQFIPADYWHGWDFLTYMLRLYQAPAAAFSNAETLRMCQALDFDFQQLKRPVRTYSKGMRQKLGLLACFLSNKPLLILDEPMSGLDPKARVLVRQQIQQAQANGKTFLFSAHHLEDVEQLCQRILVLHEGQKLFLGTLESFLQSFAATTLEQAFLRCISS